MRKKLFTLYLIRYNVNNNYYIGGAYVYLFFCVTYHNFKYSDL